MRPFFLVRALAHVAYVSVGIDVAHQRQKAVMPLAAADAFQSIRVVRAHAAEWGLAPDRIGIIGFSAGGYVFSPAAPVHDAEAHPCFAAAICPLSPCNGRVPPPGGGWNA